MTESFNIQSPLNNDPEDLSERPLSPYANLNLLLSVLSPELKNREHFLKNNRRNANHCNRFSKDIHNPDFTNDDSVHDNLKIEATVKYEVTADQKKVKSLCYERDNKSLRVLCVRIFNKYPSFPNENITICLNQLSEELNAGRRRLYDVVNILEAIEAVKRCEKNKYKWFGKKNLESTLHRLKGMALGENFVRNILLSDAASFDVEFKSLLTDQVVSNLKSESLPLRKKNDKEQISLHNMSQRFVILLLTMEQKIIDLDSLAKLLFYGENHTQSMKSTIRRLYDIANVLLTFGLLEKIPSRKTNFKKTSYRYIGPSVRLKDENSSTIGNKNCKIDHDYTCQPENMNNPESILNSFCIQDSFKNTKRNCNGLYHEDLSIANKKAKQKCSVVDFTNENTNSQSVDSVEPVTVVIDNVEFNACIRNTSDATKQFIKVPFTIVSSNTIRNYSKSQAYSNSISKEINPYNIPSLLTPSPSPVQDREAKPAAVNAVMNWKLHIAMNALEKENESSANIESPSVVVNYFSKSKKNPIHESS